MPTPALPFSRELAARTSGRPLLLLLDIDGTLSPIAPRPGDAAVPLATRHVLTEFVSLPDTHVAIVSGRAADDARRMVDVAGTWTIGNHGIEVAPPHRTPSVREDVAPFAERVAAASSRISEIAHDLPGVIVEDKKWTASVHYRLTEPSFVPALTVRVVEIAAEFGLTVVHAKKTLELRPPVRVDKGTAAIELAEALGALSVEASLLCAGDDRTDEDMFRAVRDRAPAGVTIWVSHDSIDVETAAEFCVANTDALRQLLETILRRRRASSAAAS